MNATEPGRLDGGIVVTPGTEPYWSGLTEGRLMLPRCTACAAWHWYPRVRCPSCHADAIEWVATEGTGTVYAHTTVHVGDRSSSLRPPYVVAYVELDEGIRMLANLVGPDAAQAGVGDRVAFVPSAGERPSPPTFGRLGTPHGTEPS